MVLIVQEEIGFELGTRNLRVPVHLALCPSDEFRIRKLRILESGPEHRHGDRSEHGALARAVIAQEQVHIRESRSRNPRRAVLGGLLPRLEVSIRVDELKRLVHECPDIL